MAGPASFDGVYEKCSFTWSLGLFPILIFNMAIILTIFYFLDRKAYRKDIAKGHRPDISKGGTEIKFEGGHNILFIIMIVAAVILSGVLPTLPIFQK